MSVVCCEVEVSATGWSFVQRSPNKCVCLWSWIRDNEEPLAHWGGGGFQHGKNYSLICYFGSHFRHQESDIASYKMSIIWEGIKHFAIPLKFSLKFDRKWAELSVHHDFSSDLLRFNYNDRKYENWGDTPSSLLYVGGPKRNRKRSLVGGPVVVHASAARCLLRGPFCISLPTGIVERNRGAT